MNEKIYEVTLADGTVIKNLALNGNNFISLTEITPDIFEGNLAEVTISDGENSYHYENMELAKLFHPNQREWNFILRELTPEELFQLKVNANIQYLSMMTGVDLD